MQYYCLLQAIQERHENSLLKTELDRLREENKAMRETINKSCCPNCGMVTATIDASMSTEEKQLKFLGQTFCYFNWNSLPI